MNLPKNFVIKKSLGQHFLIDKNICSKIISELHLNKQDFLLEIGAGNGVLTEIIAEKAKEVIAIEIDKNLADFLKKKFFKKRNVKIINSDVLKVDFKEILDKNRKYKVVGNIPYNITSPLLNKLLGEREYFSFFILMLQKEFAERMVAKENEKKYGTISIFVQFYSEPHIIKFVKRTCFYPPPEVDSAIVKIEIRDKPKIEVKNEEFFFTLVKEIFQKRRKTVFNSLNKTVKLKFRKEDIERALSLCNIEKSIRAENLSIEKMGMLSDVLSQFYFN